MRLLLLTLILGIFTCTAQTEKIKFTGNAKDLAGDTIYLKKYAHFDYLDDDFILDSATVDEEGNFQLEMDDRGAQLVLISPYSNEPPSYQILRKNPDHYYYSMCMNFFGRNPTIYAESGNNYQVDHWDQKNDDLSVRFADENQKKLRSYYREIDYRGLVSDENRKLLHLPAAEAWSRIEKERDERLSALNLDKDFPVQSFEHYLKTEITLGAVNEFLIWYNNKTDGSIENDLYKGLMDQYTAEEWNPHSMSYFKLTERFITYQLNLKHGKTEDYFAPSEEKLETAQKFARRNIKDKYVSNLNRTLKKM